MSFRSLFLTTALVAVCFPPFPVLADDTPITIHVQDGHGAAFGTGLGDAQVTLRDKITGDILASGVTNNGNLDLALDLPRPTPATITATGPLAQMQSLVSASRDILLIPGRNYSSGQGIVLDIPGVAIDLVTPAAGHIMDNDPEKDVLITAYINGLDGKALTTQQYEIEAIILAGAVILGKAPMVALAEEPGKYAAKARLPGAGTYIIAVTAFDPETKDGGMDQTTLIVQDKSNGTGKKK